MASCFICHKETDHLIKVDGRLLCEECAEKAKDNFILLCGICGHYRFTPRDERSIAMAAHVLNLSKGYIITQHPTIITILSGCVWCPIRLSLESLRKLAHVAPLETYNAILNRMEREKKDELLRFLLEDKVENFRPEIRKTLDAILAAMSPDAFFKVLPLLDEKRFFALVRDFSKAAVQELCALVQKSEKALPEWIEKFKEQYCARESPGSS